MLSLKEVLIIIVSVLSIIFLWHIKKRRKHPPGPLGFPFLGMLPFQIIEFLFSKWLNVLTENKKFEIYSKLYGPIWSEEFGKQRIVTLSSWNLINEAFIENAGLFSGRPTNETYKIVSHGRGIIFIDGDIWQGNRHLTIRSLKELGMGTKDLENMVCDEGDDLISYLEKLGQCKIDTLDALTKCVSNVVIRLVFNERNKYNDTNFKRYVKSLRIFGHSDVGAKTLSLAPRIFQTNIMKGLCPIVKNFLEANEYCYNFVKEKCVTKMKVQNKNIVPECVFEYFLKYRFSDSDSLSQEERNEEITQSMFDLFNAGIDTTSNLLSFCCLMLGKHEYIQTDLRNEIEELIEDSGQVNLSMRVHCPKILSFIDEIQRYCVLVPKVHHRVLRKCVFNGYELDPNDIIFGDLASLFYDPKLFEDPEQFKPYRFTSEFGKKYNPSKFLIPFGIGKRSCLGESIAMIELFIFFAKIIYTFKVSLTEETSRNFDSIIKGHSGMVHGPLDHFLYLESWKD